jgi:hypothetical protein
VPSKRSVTVYSNDGTSRTYLFDKPVLKIGRAADNNIVLADLGKSVCRNHAATTADGGNAVIIEELNSSNGTFVNGRVLKGPTPLTPNDQVKIGELTLRLWEESAESSAFTSPTIIGRKNIGSGDRVQYTAIGDTVDVAARLVSKAGPSQIIVSGEVCMELPDYDGFDSLGEAQLNGAQGKSTSFRCNGLTNRSPEETYGKWISATG